MATDPIEIRENVTAGFVSLLDAAEDMTEPFRAIAAALEASTRERFETGTAPDGSKWIPSQRVVEHGGKTLVETGDLLSSISSDFGRDFAAVGPEASFGSAVYAAIHQFGGRIAPKAGSGRKALKTPFGPLAAVVIPERPYIGLSAADRDVIRAAVADHLTPRPQAPGALA
jgi:phage virion morphogenesis protein